MPRRSLNGMRMHIIITKNQEKDLREFSKRSGLTVAEHIRRAIDSYLLAAYSSGRLELKR
jgi:hypothetical protein